MTENKPQTHRIVVEFDIEVTDRDRVILQYSDEFSNEDGTPLLVGPEPHEVWPVQMQTQDALLDGLAQRLESRGLKLKSLAASMPGVPLNSLLDGELTEKAQPLVTKVSDET